MRLQTYFMCLTDDDDDDDHVSFLIFRIGILCITFQVYNYFI